MIFVKLFRTMFVAAGFALLAGGGALAQSTVLATVNGVEITEQDLAFARAEIGEQIASMPAGQRRSNLLLYIIENQILATASQSDMLNEGPDVEALMKYYRRRAMHDLYYQRKIRDAVSEPEARALYDAQVAKIIPKTEVRARHILVKTEAEALEIIERLGRGTDFSELAQEKSIGPSGAEGGDLGYFSREKMLPEFSAVAFNLEKGEFSEPVKTRFGWHVIKQEDKRESKPPPFDEVKDGLLSEMVRRKAVEVISGLRKAAKIDILDPDLKQALEAAGQRGSFLQ